MQSKLLVTHRARNIGDQARRSISNIINRILQVDAVKGIEHFPSELQRCPFRQMEVLVQSPVCSEQPWAAQRISSSIAEREWGRRRKSCRIEPFHSIVRHTSVRIADSIRTNTLI